MTAAVLDCAVLVHPLIYLLNMKLWKCLTSCLFQASASVQLHCLLQYFKTEKCKQGKKNDITQAYLTAYST